MTKRTSDPIEPPAGLKNLDNVAAVCRTAEALGCQSVHAIAEEKAKYKASGRVSAGSDKWLDLELWLDTGECLRTLKGRGYRIAVTCMDELGAGVETRPIHEVRLFLDSMLSVTIVCSHL